ncbi:MAG: hypothetical protein LUG25_03515 [Oscillospiraceae bacterium]|nr:hypothetical protein [Oscillospiraceae bacterium]
MAEHVTLEELKKIHSVEDLRQMVREHPAERQHIARIGLKEGLSIREIADLLHLPEGKVSAYTKS